MKRMWLVLPLLCGACQRTASRSAPAPAARHEGAKPFEPIQANDRALFAQLDFERKNRPMDTPRVEQVLDAVENGGLRLEARKQFLGRTVGALFCAGGQTTSGTGLAVCEFADEAAAHNGREYSLRAFAKVFPHRQLLVNRKTVLTIVTPSATPEQEAQAKTAAQVFERL
jgi:hypothetical protein